MNPFSCFCRCRNKTLPYSAPSTNVDPNVTSTPHNPHPLSQTDKLSNLTSAVNSAAQTPFSQIPVPPIIELRSQSFTIPTSASTQPNQSTAPQKKDAPPEQTPLKSISQKSINHSFENEISQKGQNEISKRSNESIVKANSEDNNLHPNEDNEVYVLNQNVPSDERTFINTEIQELIKQEHARLFQRDIQSRPFMPFQPFSRPSSDLDVGSSREVSIIHSGIRSQYHSQISKNKIQELSHETDDSISPVFSRDPSELNSQSNFQHSRQASNETIPTLSNPVSRAHSLARFASFMAEPPSAIRESQEIQDALSRDISRESILSEEREGKDEKEEKEGKEGNLRDLSKNILPKPRNVENSRENSVISAANSISPIGVKSENNVKNSPIVQPRPKLSPGKSERITNRRENQLLRNREKLHEHHSFSNLSL